MAKGKGLVLMLAAMTMSLMFVASATSPILNGTRPSDDQASEPSPSSNDNGIFSRDPDKAAAKETANGAKCCDEKAPLKDASGLSVLRGRVLDMKTGKPVAGALVVLQPVNGGAVVKTDPACPIKDAASVQSTCCDKMQASSGCSGNGGVRDAPTGQGSTRPTVEPTEPPAPSMPPMSPMPPMPPMSPQIPVPQPFLQTKSDTKGVYSIPIKPGDFMLNIVAEGYLPYFGEVGVPKATKFDRDVALEPAPVPDCKIDGFITDAADGKRLPGVNVLIIRLPADFPFSEEALKGMAGIFLGDRPAEPGMTPEQAAEMKENEAQRHMPQNGCPEKPPLPPDSTPPKDQMEVILPEAIPLVTDHKGHFETKLFSGRVLVIAFARGYDPQWALLDIPAKSSISLQLNLDRSLPQTPILSEPVREPPIIPDIGTADTPPKPR